ncbi:MAG: tetratricopeptide repeat protein [Bacteroidetes bacterium]|nr:tetratricopeptide repeat protein [Bacteroidota bacterium]
MIRSIVALILPIIVGFPFIVRAQDVEALMRQAARLEAQFREEEALPVYQEVLRRQPDQVAALCRCSDLSCRIGNRQTNREKKIGFFTSGSAYARSAWRLDSTNSEVNIAMAFSLARMALIQSGKERVTTARDIKRYAENAIRYDPKSYKAWHILGRWNYEVSGLSAVERFFARWFFGALPEASLGEAIACYEKSMARKPDFMLNYYELARCYRRDGQKDKAVRLLRQMDALKDGMYDDREVRQQGRQLLKELEN